MTGEIGNLKFLRPFTVVVGIWPLPNSSIYSAGFLIVDFIVSFAFAVPRSDLLESFFSELPLIYSITLSSLLFVLTILLSLTDYFLLLSERGENVAIGYTASRSLFCILPGV